MSKKQPKWLGRQVEVDGKTGTIIYAGGYRLLVEFSDKSRVWLDRPHTHEGDTFKILGGL